MDSLGLEHFARYFEAVHGHPPFPWQTRLLSSVLRDGVWPKLLDLPTGSGKTSVIDVALFHLAIDGGRSASRRIVLIVDRRTVVDQAFERGKVIAEALSRSGDEIVRTMAVRLRALTGGEGPPLALAQLRGGIPREDAWARRPDQPLVAVSTVDQIGSRLLFRGYGVSEGMRSIHAGLLGEDTLFLLDEVHLSRPFSTTLEAVGHYRKRTASALPSRWQVVAMSATAGNAGAEHARFALDGEDEKDERLMARVRASKPVTLAPEVKVTGSPQAKHEAFAAACAEQASELALTGRTIGVVLNRVDSARAAFAILQKKLPRVFLVTGRMRPLDRNDLDVSLRSLLRSGRIRDSNAEPVVVVATQCIEAGADYDFDALVTECASLDALRQRFGRLNRTGAI
jgi:CRISPR-associated endonuclease/helicase Cas3